MKHYHENDGMSEPLTYMPGCLPTRMARARHEEKVGWSQRLMRKAAIVVLVEQTLDELQSN